MEVAGTSRIDIAVYRNLLLDVIRAYKSFPALWCTNSKDYLNKKLKQEAYVVLLNKYQKINPKADLEEVKKKINILRTNFRREQKRIKQAIRSKPQEHTPKLWYFEELSFLSSMESRYEEPPALPIIKENSLENSPTVSLQEFAKVNFETEEPVFKLDTNQTPNFYQMPPLPAESTVRQQMPSTSNTNITTSRSRKRKLPRKTEFREVLDLVKDCFDRDDNEYDIIARGWAMKLAKMSNQQRLLAEKAINDFLIGGQLGLLTFDDIQFKQVTFPSNFSNNRFESMHSTSDAI